MLNTGGENLEPYLHITDNFIESGITSVATQRFYWNTLIGVDLRAKTILVKTKVGELMIFKTDLSGSIPEEDLVAFLKGKLSQHSAKF